MSLIYKGIIQKLETNTQIAKNPQNTVVLPTKTYVEIRADNVSEWPDEGEISRADLLKIGFKEKQISMWEFRKIAINLYPEKRREYRAYIILPIKQFLLNRMHAGPGSKNNLVG